MAGEKIAVGMSGGVDSSMSLLLLKKAGWEPVGISLKLPSWHGENACCTVESLRVAREVCGKLGAPYEVLDCTRDFEREVVDYFVSELAQGRTPNPCVHCNRYFKFARLFEWAQAHGIERVATGHYARVERDENGNAHLLRPKDKTKDQTYGLCLLPQEWLQKIEFPLADYAKQEVYETAQREGFPIFSKTKQSQDLCFVPAKRLPAFLEDRIGKKPGNVVDVQGSVLGVHRGTHLFTVGQRRGLGLQGGYHVKAIDAEKQEVIVTRDKRELETREVIVKPFSFCSGESPSTPLQVQAQTRYRQKPSAATLYPPKDADLRVVFDEPADAAALGQVCAFYDGDGCIGGGIISKCIYIQGG